jgi:hypothetical protein
MLYVTTPCNGFSGYFNYLDVYNPVTNAWTSLANSASPHGNPAFGVINDKFYVAGGQTAVTNALEMYDPENNTWTSLTPMPTAVENCASVALNGFLYVFGGDDGVNRLTTVQAYNPHHERHSGRFTL